MPARNEIPSSRLRDAPEPTPERGVPAAGTVALHAAPLNGTWPTPPDEPPAEGGPWEGPTP